MKLQGGLMMTKLLGDSFSVSFLKDLTTCKQSVTIISPYVTKGAVDSLIKVLPSNLECKLITIPPGEDYLFGSVEVNALRILKQSKFEICYLPNLHTKIYLIDQDRVYIGSANFTSKGWILNNQGNVEDMVKIQITKSELTHMQKRYITPSVPLDLNGDWVKKLDEGKKLFGDYTKIRQKIKLWEKTLTGTTNTGSNIREYFSNYLIPQTDYPHNFKFPITKNAGKQAKKDKSDFLFKLGRSSAKPDAKMFVPFSIIEKVLVGDYLGKDSWMIHINFDKKGKPFLRSFNQKKQELRLPLDLKNFSGKLEKTAKILELFFNK
jgi:hypothetical protein